MRNPYLFGLVGGVVLILIYVLYSRRTTQKEIVYEQLPPSSKEGSDSGEGEVNPKNHITDRYKELFENRWKFYVDGVVNIITFSNVRDLRVDMEVESTESKGKYDLFYFYSSGKVVLTKEEDEEMFTISFNEKGTPTVIRLLQYDLQDYDLVKIV